MFHPLSLFIALRYSRSNKDNGFISFISFFSITGIALGVLSLIIVISVMNGFENQLKERILGIVPQVVVTTDDKRLQDWESLPEQLTTQPGVQQAAPYVEARGMVQSDSQLKGIAIQGLYPNSYNPIKEHVVTGNWHTLFSGGYHIFIGQHLANQLGVVPGDKVRIMVAGKTIHTPVGRMPSQRKFTVAGIFSSRSEIDESVIFTSGEKLAKLMRLPKGSITGIRLYLDDAFTAPEISKVLSDNHADWLVLDWRRTHGDLFGAVGMEKRMMGFMLMLIVAVAAFNIVSGLVMMVTEKTAEIAILMTQGLNSQRVKYLFMLQGLYNGVLGAVAGVVLGVIIAMNINSILSSLNIILIPGTEDGLPVLLIWSDVVFIALGALLLTLVATLYPARIASKISPASVLRYE